MPLELKIPTAAELRAWRATLDINQSDAAIKFLVTRGTYARWEEIGVPPGKQHAVALRFAELTANPAKVASIKRPVDGRTLRAKLNRRDKDVLEETERRTPGSFFDLRHARTGWRAPYADAEFLAICESEALHYARRAERNYGQFLHGEREARDLYTRLAAHWREIVPANEAQTAREALARLETPDELARELEEERERRRMLIEKIDSEDNGDFP